MARIVYTSRALDDLDRVTDFLLQNEPEHAPTTINLIVGAVSILENHPLLGRCVASGMRELLISRGRTGYAALYSLEQAESVALILAIRHQREAGYDGSTGESR